MKHVTVRVLRAYLESLSPADSAGQQASSCDCPVACVIKTLYPDGTPSVDYGSAVLEVDGVWHTVPLALNVKAFIIAFDETRLIHGSWATPAECLAILDKLEGVTH